MKILFNTNVIISAIITRGNSFDIIKDAAYKHDVYYTENLFKEIKQILPAWLYTSYSPQQRYFFQFMKDIIIIIRLFLSKVQGNNFFWEFYFQFLDFGTLKTK